MDKRLPILLITLFMTLGRIFAQGGSFPDTLSVKTGTDSTSKITNETESDTTSNGSLDAPIYYWADKGGFSRVGNKIYLKGHAKIVYQNMTLEAEKVMIDQEKKFLFAEGVADSTDSLGNPVLRGAPIFTEKGEEPIKGHTLYYDFTTKRGKIRYGTTEMPPGYYKGEKINKISKNTLLVEDGYFTSCEYIDHPHFYFRSDKMRISVKNEVVARPVYFYIADIPLMVIPFGVFPNKGGRHSGLLVPSYGESGYGGRFLKNLGYYWAPNDYMDATLTTDFYDKLGFTYNAKINYTLRYVLNGAISGFYYPKDPNTGQDRTRWAVRINHSHTIDPTLKITASGQFQSDQTLVRELSSNINERTNQILTSNLTLSKSFKGTKNSMSLNLSRTQNLNNGNLTYTAPSLRFTRSQASVLETVSGSSVTGRRNWYDDIYFSYNGNLLNKGSRTATADTGGTYITEESQGIEHRITLNSPQKILSHFNITPSLNYREVWVNEITAAEAVLEDSQYVLQEQQQKKFAAQRTYNASIGLKTTIYGMFEPNIGALKFIRHKIDPQITYTLQPDFSDPSYGYFSQVKDPNGEDVGNPVDKFKKSPFGGTSRGRQQTLGFSVGNLFQAKMISDGKEEKIDLFTLNFSTGYNLAADSLKWSPLTTNFRASPLQGVNINLSAQHSFYQRNSAGRSNINELMINKGQLLRLMRLSGSLSFSLDNKLFSGEEKKGAPVKTEEEETTTGEEGINRSGFVQIEKISDEEAAKKLDIPWRMNFNLNYSLDRSDINNVNERLDLGVTASLSLTKNWRVNWTARLNVLEQDITYQSFSIYRDLHCWEMSFNWQPEFGYYAFQINIKESVLQDIKLTKHPSARAYY